MVEKVQSDNYKLNRLICEKFDKILSTIMKQSETPEECVYLIKYLNNSRSIEIFKLKVKFQISN